MTQVGNYVVVKNIGSGQFGSAYTVKHVVTGRTLCMKQIPITAENQETSMKEARFLAQLGSHDMKNVNVVRYEESFLDKDNLCIVMELCDGDLDTEIKQHKASRSMYTEDEIMELFVQILMGLAHIHNNRILHRDLKAQNIFLSKGGIVKLGDLGIAKVVESTLEQCKSFVGTPYYMAPEVCSSSPYTSQADMWSLGCVLYELCTLEHAFSADSLYALIFRIINGGYDPIDQSRYSPSLSSLVSALLDKDPSRRRSCRALLNSEFIQAHIEKTMNKTVAGQLMRPHGLAGRRGNAPLTQPQPGPQTEPVRSPIAPVTPKEQLRARKLAEADRRMREVTLQIHTTAHEKERVRARKQEMLQGTAQRGGAGPRAQQQQRSRSCHGSSLTTRPAADSLWSPPSPTPASLRPKSESGLMPGSHLSVEYARQNRIAPPGEQVRHRPLGGRAPAPNPDGVTAEAVTTAAVSRDDRLACTGTTGYKVPSHDDEEDAWAAENADLLAGDDCGHVGEGTASSAMAAGSGSRPQDMLPELHIPRTESAGTQATPTTAPSTVPSTGSTPVRFGMDTLERKQFSGLGSPSAMPASPLCSPVVHFGSGLPSDGGSAFAYRQTPSSPGSGGLASPSSPLPGASHGGMSPLAQAARLRATTSTDYSEAYSEDYDSEQSGSSEGARAAPARSQARALLENLRSAQDTHVATDDDAEIIADEEPSGALLMTLRSSDMKAMCRAALGRFFDQAYRHCRSRYVQDGVDMQEVQAELLQLVDLPAATKRGAVQQLELLVYQELHGP